MRSPFYLVACLVSVQLCAQTPYVFAVAQKADMPMATANNAVIGAMVNGNPFAYSFCGIDTSLTNDGIHLRSFKYDVVNDQWALLPDVPDTLGKIAASASLVDGIIYVIGGYHVFDGPPFELSSNKVHRFDTQTDSWLSDGADVPVAIDDQVQVVWRDSLIMVVTGWSNTTNVPDVQIYDPANDTWLTGTSVPNNSLYKAFGANGHILGDTLYYYGGAASSFNFPARQQLRKGYIDPSDPTQISWFHDNDTPGTLYRPGAAKLDSAIHWIGGASTSYNYDAVAYNGSGVVSPTMEIRSYRADAGWSVADPAMIDSLPVMDIRGVAEFSQLGSIGTVYLLGGIGFDQEVLNTTFELTGSAVFIADGLRDGDRIDMFPNPATDMLMIRGVDIRNYSEYEVIDAMGRANRKGVIRASDMAIDVRTLPAGGYFLKLIGTDRVIGGRFWSVK